MIKSIDFGKFSSIKIGSRIDVLLINEIDEYENYKIIGKANNLLVSNEAENLAILSKEFDYIYIKNNLLHIGASTSSGKVLSFCKRENIANFEFLSKLPGSIGGIVKMNAGLKSQEVFNKLVAIKTKDGYIEKESIEYRYRYTDIKDIIYEAIFKIENGFSQNLINEFLSIRSKQPKEPSAGSCFKNPKGDYAGRLIEAVELKGKTIGDASFSQKHANFLVNLGNASFDDAYKLINLATERVYNEFGITLEREIVIL